MSVPCYPYALITLRYVGWRFYFAMGVKLDEFDFKILDEIQRNNLLTAEQISRKVSLSPSAIQRRLRRLRENGVIEADSGQISPAAVGMELMAVVEVTLEREDPRTLDNFTTLMKKADHVVQCYYVTGDADFVIIMVARDMNQFESLVRICFSENASVKKFLTRVVVKRIKWGLSVPLESP